MCWTPAASWSLLAHGLKIPLSIMHHKNRYFLVELLRWRKVKKHRVGDKKKEKAVFKHLPAEVESPETNLRVCFVRHTWKWKPTAFLANAQKLLEDTSGPSIVFSGTESEAGAQWVKTIYHLWPRYMAYHKNILCNGQFTFQMASTVSVSHDGPRKCRAYIILTARVK